MPKGDDGRKRLRPVDLARTAGVSTQQIRNYADEGILPPAPRTPAGYRRFDDSHREALITYRALARGYGWGAARAVMRAVHSGDVSGALALVDAAHAALHEQRLALRSAGEALEAVAGQPPGDAPPRSDLRIGELAGRLGVRTSALRVWEAAGLLRPRREQGTGYRLYGPADVRDARMITMLRQGRHPMSQIQDILDGLRRTGSADALRAAIARRQEELTRRSRAMLDGAGHLDRYLSALEPRSAAEPPGAPEPPGGPDG
ncbi:MerR family transcriptional regulator [Microbispora sp. RL4-1S]|uniref:MerR family transcriptional regulator n=1 Tax=Microbispora oryzae TaxID=2806554 RepID=A0A941APM4_9ACTN|nr:MerR family transcriptional regulator [Microbispora oryzae]MBP2703844.1 MerR family transcriptional regulator [Microbispora oryzae]